MTLSFCLEVLNAMLLAAALYLVATGLVARAAGVAVRHYCLGMGPTIARWKRFTLKLFPAGSSIEFKLDSDADIANDPEHDHTLDRQSTAVRLALIVAGPLACLLGAFCLIPNEAWHGFLKTFGQLVAGIFNLGATRSMLAAGQQFVLQQGRWAFIGLLLAKTAAGNLLPFPTSNGGQALLVLTGKPLAVLYNSRLVNIWAQAGVSLMLCWTAVMLYALLVPA